VAVQGKMLSRDRLIETGHCQLRPDMSQSNCPPRDGPAPVKKLSICPRFTARVSSDDSVRIVRVVRIPTGLVGSMKDEVPIHRGRQDFV